MRNYEKKSVPFVNSGLSLSKINNEMIVASIDGQLKEIFCDYDVLNDVLSNINGMNTFSDLEAIYSKMYGEDVVICFLNTLLEENLIDIIRENKEASKLHVGIIGEGYLYSAVVTRFAKRFSSVSGLKPSELEKNIDNYDVFTLISSNLTNQIICDVNNIMLKHHKPYIMFGYTGNKFVIGPFVFPWVTECYECHLTHRLAAIIGNEEEKCITMSNILSLKSFTDIPVDFDTSKISVLIDAVSEDISKLSYKTATFAYVGKEVYIDNNLDIINISEKRFSPTTDCAACHGKNKNYSKVIVPPKDNGYIKECDNIKYQFGGFRSVSLEDTEKLVSNTLSKMGIGIKIVRVNNNPYSHIIPVYDSILETTHKNNTPYFFEKQVSHGKGINEKQAYFSAAFEIFERLSSRYYGEIPLIRSTINEVGTKAISLDVFSKQIFNHNTPYEPYSKDVPVDWVWGKSLISGEDKLIPASMVFLTKTVFRGDFFPNSSSGLSAGSTLEDAMLQGLFELIEHDAWIIGQANPTKLPLIDIHSSKNTALLDAVCKIEQMGLKVISRNYTNDIGITAIRTWILNPNNYSDYASCGFGASISPELALERSITEAIQAATHLPGEEITEYSRKNAQDLLFGRYSIYSMHYLQQKDMNTFSDSMCMNLSDLPSYDPSSVQDALDYTISQIRNALPDADVLFVDLTREAIGIPAVKMFIVGDVQRISDPIVALSNRMFDFGETMGYSTRKPQIEDLYMGPHPH